MNPLKGEHIIKKYLSISKAYNIKRNSNEHYHNINIRGTISMQKSGIKNVPIKMFSQL